MATGIKAAMPGGCPKVLLGIGSDQDSDKGEERMIRAGWVLQYRLHGVPPAGTGKGCNLEIAAGEPGLRIQIEFQMKTPTFPAKILKGVSTLRPGTRERSRFEDKPVPRPEEDGFHVPYT